MTRSLWMGAVLVVLACVAPRPAAAQSAFNVGRPYNPGTAANNERCIYADATITQVSGAIQFLGKVGISIWSPSAGCVTNLVDTPRDVIANYKLWKIDKLHAGHTPVLCEAGAEWDTFLNMGDWFAELTSPGLGGPTAFNYSKGCGSGYYNLGVEGYVLVNGTWKGGTLFSGWAFMDLTQPPPPK